MKRLSTVLLTGSLALMCLPAWAGNNHPGYTYAQVVRANPMYETVRIPVDEQVCWEEQTRQQRRPSAAPIVLGAILGGVVGHQFGGGGGKAALTMAGAAIGGSIGNQIALDNYRGGAYPVTQTQCRVQTNWRTEQRIAGWDVAYKFRGGIYHTHMQENPGRRIRIRADAVPAGYYRG